MVASGLFLASLIALALGKPTARNLKLHESRPSAPNGFSLVGSADSNRTLKLRLALAESNFSELERKLYDVSTPKSANYGKHLSKAEVQQLVAPGQDSIDAVNSWLKENDITAKTISSTGEWISFEVPVSKANDLFDADFSVFKHDDTGVEAIRTLSYSIPAELQGHLDLVHPTVTFPNPYSHLPVFQSPVKKTAEIQNFTAGAIPSSCSSTITPACLQAIYNIPTTAATESSNQLGVTGFIDQYANKKDLKTFLKKYRTDISSSTTFTLQTLDGGSNSQTGSKAGVEANLDIQYTVGVATGVPTTFISVGDDFQDGDLEGFLDVINALLDEDAPPSVLTTSYGQDESTISRALAVKLCNAYAQLGARGVSILFASGDGGVSGSQSASCSKFVPTFPSGCPYMTSVGATQGVNPETAADFSSGGFSNYWGVPDYQSDAVSTYLSALGKTNSGKYNASGRGFPDVSTQGVSFEVVVDGSVEAVDGTSCASPTFASIISLVNDKLVAAGKSPLGFLNPFLYSDGVAALNDITSGSNPGCNTNGFPAKKGWDPVTGLGTPDFKKLLTAVGL
ncbi:family S53 protease [Dichomitus squalens]|uniref:tripeptidyl-peptidase II n=2 Tax=Dichomitus squalens TaxID=114155 RepID=A0A4Q9N8A0_9APHY|nr:family S53 protease [Dichomitus squalens LYAD-421 SS1]EJF58006.1 family S53 protease [Dichomitus squalens LYAD-421 SS1]TBU36899.1 family S53 protease [Dichomitus squalens]TBU56524.1 family S53 protease [Dichomitus squalens]